MQKENLIPAGEFCMHYDIEFSFIHSLQETGLLTMENISGAEFIHISQLAELEKFIRLHYEFEINMQGIEAITHLLQRVKTMQDEMIVLKNKLRMYEIEE